MGAGRADLPEAILIAHRAKIPVVSIDYRMPPEHPFPAAVDDVVAVTWSQYGRAFSRTGMRSRWRSAARLRVVGSPSVRSPFNAANATLNLKPSPCVLRTLVILQSFPKRRRQIYLKHWSEKRGAA